MVTMTGLDARRIPHSRALCCPAFRLRLTARIHGCWSRSSSRTDQAPSGLSSQTKMTS